MVRPLLALMLTPLLLAGCSATLKERNTELEGELELMEDRERKLQDRVHELEHDLDACDATVDRKAVREILEEVGVDTDVPLFAVLYTSEGAIRVQLFPDAAPRTVANFVGLAEGTQPWTHPRTGEVQEGTPLYRELLFHRVLPDYAIQTGDPMGLGTGGSGTTVPDEFSEDLLHDRPGVLSMANSGPNTSESQFFISLAPAPQLNGKHSAFGRVVEGMDVVQAIAAGPTGAVRPDRPNEEVTLHRVEIVRGEASPKAPAP